MHVHPWFLVVLLVDFLADGHDVVDRHAAAAAELLLNCY